MPPTSPAIKAVLVLLPPESPSQGGRDSTGTGWLIVELLSKYCGELAGTWTEGSAVLGLGTAVCVLGQGKTRWEGLNKQLFQVRASLQKGPSTQLCIGSQYM